MRRIITVAIICSGVLLSASQATQEQADESTKDSAYPVFINVCGKCHPKERVTAMRRTRPQWEEVINTMITVRGAQISDDDFDTVLGFLTREYGRVNVNRAPAADMADVLHIPDKVAGAIVTYRSEHGPFEDFDALAKVPGVDREKLEKKRDAILF